MMLPHDLALFFSFSAEEEQQTGQLSKFTPDQANVKILNACKVLFL